MCQIRFNQNRRVVTDIPAYQLPNPDTLKELLDALEDAYFQFGYPTTDKKYVNSGGLSTLENIEAILLEHKRIEKYRKNGKYEWYKKRISR